MPQHGTAVNQALSEGRWVREPVPPCGMPCLDGETPPVASNGPWGQGLESGAICSRKAGEFTLASSHGITRAGNPGIQLGAALGSGLLTGHSRVWQSCSPVGARARQGVVASPCLWGAAGVIANAEDPELVARLATWIERPVGHQREVVTPLGEVSRDRRVLHPLWGSDVLGS